jgi:hypothetical protein
MIEVTVAYPAGQGRTFAQRDNAANWLLSLPGARLCEPLLGTEELSSSEALQPSAMAERTHPTTALTKLVLTRKSSRKNSPRSLTTSKKKLTS